MCAALRCAALRCAVLCCAVQTPITLAFPEYSGPKEYKSCLEYITEQFEDINKNKDSKRVYTHVTCATDKNNVCLALPCLALCCCAAVLCCAVLCCACAVLTSCRVVGWVGLGWAQVHAVFEAVKDIVIRQSLAAAGLGSLT